MTFRGKSWYYFMVSQIRWIIGAVGLGGDFLDCGRKANCSTIRHGYATESTVATPHLLLNGTRVPIVIVGQLVCSGQPRN